MHKFDHAMHDLICDTLRGEHVRTMTSDELKIYTYKLGCALHNVPHYLRETGTIPEIVKAELNELDPTFESSQAEHGEWVTRFLIRIS
ncbi:hypothetical protein VCHA53O466_50469 [Vibrio chagasii]|nr:hypothetical protein VCHA53O466_50469 [Vibrio chagasii]